MFRLNCSAVLCCLLLRLVQYVCSQARLFTFQLLEFGSATRVLCLLRQTLYLPIDGFVHQSLSVQAELFSCRVLGIAPTGMCVLRLDCSAPRVWFCYYCIVLCLLRWHFTCPVMDLLISVQAELFSCPVLGRTLIGPATARRLNLSTIPIRQERRATFKFFRPNHKISWFLVSTFSCHAYLFS